MSKLPTRQTEKTGKAMSPCRQARNRRSDYSLSRHSPYTSKSNPGHLRASSTRLVLGSLLYAKTQFAMPTGSQMQSICSLSRHSPYTSKSNPGHLRASSTRLVLICMCMAHCFAQKKHLRDAGAFVMYVTRFELATFWKTG